MASTDSTIPDSVTGDSAGSQSGQSFTDKAKSVLKGNIPVKKNLTVNKGTEQSAEKDVKERMDQGVGDTGSRSTQNTLV